MRKLLALFTLVGLLGTAAVAGVASADPNLVLQAPPHRHFINGSEVGPNYCDNPELKAAFTQFHANTHTHNGVTGEIGPIAPGLHNGMGGEITFGGCS